MSVSVCICMCVHCACRISESLFLVLVYVCVCVFFGVDLVIRSRVGGNGVVLFSGVCSRSGEKEMRGGGVVVFSHKQFDSSWLLFGFICRIILMSSLWKYSVSVLLLCFEFVCECA